MFIPHASHCDDRGLLSSVHIEHAHSAATRFVGFTGLEAARPDEDVVALGRFLTGPALVELTSLEEPGFETVSWGGIVMEAGSGEGGTSISGISRILSSIALWVSRSIISFEREPQALSSLARLSAA